MSIEEYYSDKAGGQDTKSEGNPYQMEILSYGIHFKKYYKSLIIPRG